MFPPGPSKSFILYTYMVYLHSICRWKLGPGWGTNFKIENGNATILRSTEPKAHRWAYSIPMVRRPSASVPPFTISTLSKTAWPIKAKYYVEPPWVGGTKVCSRHLGHMTKMATTPMYGKNPSKSSSPEPAGRFSRNLVCSIGDSCPS